VVERGLRVRLPQFWQVRGFGMVEVSRKGRDFAAAFQQGGEAQARCGAVRPLF
jgi:hypothetical protein